jgi:hypothetical protein
MRNVQQFAQPEGLSHCSGCYSGYCNMFRQSTNHKQGGLIWVSTGITINITLYTQICRPAGLIILDVSKNHSAFIFKVKNSLKTMIIPPFEMPGIINPAPRRHISEDLNQLTIHILKSKQTHMYITSTTRKQLKNNPPHPVSSTVFKFVPPVEPL